MSTITFDPQKLVGPINELIKVQLPRATSTALNQALFETRKRLQDEARSVFNNPVPFTVNSFLYEKPKQVEDEIRARVFVRDDAPKGNAPSRYLDPQIRGGPAYVTRFQRSLLNTVVTQIDGRQTQAAQRGTLLRPSASDRVRRNRYGNMAPTQYNQILSAIKGGKSSADFQGAGAVPFNLRGRYAYLDEEALDNQYFVNRFRSYPRKAGIYKIEYLQKQPRFYRVMTQGSVPTYNSKFKFFDLSAQTITNEFTRRLRSQILR
jgi:hypothetical protein